MEHKLIVNLDPDMSPNSVEELKHAISMWRGVRGVEWQESAQQSAGVDDNLIDIQEIADSLQPFTPVIQWGAVSQKWHVTLADWKDDVYTGDTILQALRGAQQSVPQPKPDNQNTIERQASVNSRRR